MTLPILDIGDFGAGGKRRAAVFGAGHEREEVGCESQSVSL
jgi:hypothetical protein